MGFLRLYLALCVVAGHAGDVFPWEMHNGRQAVQIFFIISGFYIELILSGKYHTRTAFYKSRALRIFPPYALVAAGVCLLSLACRLLFGDWFFLGRFSPIRCHTTVCWEWSLQPSPTSPFSDRIGSSF